MNDKIKSNSSEHPHLARRWVQILFLIVVISIGIRFYVFVSQLEAGILPDFERPPGFEAFLPIICLAALITKKAFKEIKNAHSRKFINHCNGGYAPHRSGPGIKYCLKP